MSVIQLKNVWKQYGKNAALRGIDLSVDAGQIIGYIGPNGAGKSTTIKILTGLIADFDGLATVMEMDVKTDSFTIKKHIGYIPEQAALYEVLTPKEYLHFVAKLHELDAAQAEKKIGEMLRLFDLDTKADQRMNSFSKGMRQKVLLISGLMHNPEIIFLDEPLSGLDANAVILVKEILAQLRNSGKTIFYSSHIMDVVEKISDRIVIINSGQVIADGSFNELQLQAHTGSLENIFTQLTGDENHSSVASEFVDILKN